MILFIGTHTAGYFVGEVAAIYKETVTYTGCFGSMEEVADAALESLYDYVVINADELPGAHAEIADTLARIQKATTSTLVVMALKYSAQSELIQDLIRLGIHKLLVSPNLSVVKEQLEELLAGETRARPGTEPAAPPPPDTSVPIRTAHAYKTIAVTGVIARMGTTTQALQFVKYLLLRGKKACYVQMNNSPYVQALEQMYQVDASDASLGKTTYQNVAMFHNQDKISEILKLGYDYYVYDYGVWDAPSFNRVSFLEKDQKFIVCGTNPMELTAVNQALEIFYETDTQYIFNLTPEDEQDDILERMDDKAGRTYFSRYTPDPFVYSSNSNAMYTKIFKENKTPDKNPDAAADKKKSWWNRRKA